MNRKANDAKSVVMVITSMLIFGTIGIFRRYIPISSALLAFTRGTMGGLFILFFILLKRKGGREKLPVGTLIYLALTGALMGINWILLFEAYSYTTVAVATLCYYMEPTIVMLLSPLLFQEKLTGKKAVCAAVSIAGMVLVSGALEGGGAGSGNLRGIALGLGAALFYAAVVIMNKRAGGIDAYYRTTVQLLSAGAVMIPYLLLTKGFTWEGMSPSVLVLLCVVGIVHTGIAYLLYFGSIDGLRAQSIAVFSYIDPVSAVLFSALLLKEPLSGRSLTGAAMIIGSALVSELRS